MTDFSRLADGSITSPRGFLAGAVYAGIKAYGADKLDLGLLYSPQPCTAAGVFTTNAVKAAPVLLCQERLAGNGGRAQAILVNAGVANACTGRRGEAMAEEMALLAATRLGIDPGDTLIASTGKIGVQIPLEKVRTGLNQLVFHRDGGHDFARAILTTDTHPKEIAVICQSPRGQYTIAGCAKGAGMIHPNMATLLAFITTDAAVPPDGLQTALRRAADRSFNAITVDGDTSTNDTLLILANGAAHQPVVTSDSPEAAVFQSALDYVCIELAKMIARDGEGATRLVAVTVSGAESEADARRAARAVAGSNLTKCAVHGQDPNWGRILCAVGYSGAKVDPGRLHLRIGEVTLVIGGEPVAFEVAAARAALAEEEVKISVDLGLGDGMATAWGCDLSEEYVRFNAEYTT